MTIYYSPSLKNFVDSELFSTIPDDAIEVEQANYNSLVEGRSKGQSIEVNAAGAVVLVKVPLKPEQLIASFNFALQQNLDAVATQWGYSNIVAAASYANSTNPQFKADAEALIAWRDASWAKAFEIEAGTLPTSVEKFMAKLPKAPTQPTIN